MSRYVVAVSGGIDSVSLLDMLTKLPQHELIVAHVDHGIRESSTHDAHFVSELAAKYQLPFEVIRYDLGPDASEDIARTVRYAFLRSLARKHDAKIVTAHHADDVLESIAINIHRGTGWRGLATHDSGVVRPLLAMHKAAILNYAQQAGLEWREDETNQSDRYLRNQIRKHIHTLTPEQKKELLALRHRQRATKQVIEAEVRALVGEGPQYSRYLMTHVPTRVAMECLRHITEARLTRPQLYRVLHAIKTAQPGKRYQAGNGVDLRFSTRNFLVSLIK